MTSEFKSHAMPFSNALTIINNQTSLAQDYRFSVEQNLPGACTLSDQLVITLNNDVNMSRMTPMAVLAYHAIKGVGRWDDSIEDAREVANTVLFQLKNIQMVPGMVLTSLPQNLKSFFFKSRVRCKFSQD